MRLLALAIVLASGVQDSGKKIEIRGAYGDPHPFWKTGARLSDYGVNAIFVRSQSLTPEAVARARAEGCRVYAEYATLNGNYGDWVAKHPDAHPIDDSGKPAPKATWFMGVCPTNKGFREFRMNGLREMVRTLDVDGVWMDYLHWHAQFEDSYPVLLKTCFNDSCLAAFEAWSGLKVEGDTVPRKAAWVFKNAAKAWEDWRVSVLVDWAREFREIVKSVRPKALVGNFQAAWKDDDFWGARRRCLGLDFEPLAKHVDVFSPMPYHGVSGMPPEYVADYVEWFGRRLPIQTEAGKFPQVWPIVQANDVKADVFEKVLRGGLGGKSTGVMMFALEHVARDPEKMAAMKKVYESVR
jgi:hypothetical protein